MAKKRAASRVGKEPARKKAKANQAAAAAATSNNHDEEEQLPPLTRHEEDSDDPDSDDESGSGSESGIASGDDSVAQSTKGEKVTQVRLGALSYITSVDLFLSSAGWEMDEQAARLDLRLPRHRVPRPPPHGRPPHADAALEDGLEDAAQGHALRRQRDRGDEEAEASPERRNYPSDGELGVQSSSSGPAPAARAATSAPPAISRAAASRPGPGSTSPARINAPVESTGAA